MNPKASTFTESVPTSQIAQKVETMIRMSGTQRRSFERRWYDNNFFDDGFHFRYISRTTGKIIDLTDRGQVNVPHRALPKASRQIRGVANLLLQPDYTPVVYPKSVSKTQYEDPNEYMSALSVSKDTAKKIGHWITQEWKNQELKEKLIHMVILAAKHGVSYLQVWPDAVEEKIKTKVYDAFDIYLLGILDSIYDSPFIGKVIPTNITNVLANENFDEEQRAKLLPDNKYANSEIKQAYMQGRFQMGMVQSEQASTILLKEFFIKEYVNENNYQQAEELSANTGAMEGKKEGDMIMRHVFTAGNVWLLDEYVDLPEYPFVDFRFEPGPIYQVPLIERFIPANKTLDILASRIERYANTMVTGTWIKRKGENMEVTNIPGGQVLEYTATPPVQGNPSNVPPFMFEFMNFIERIIEEQGATTSSGISLPSGVKSGVAIESVKSTEYANLKIASDMLKKTVRTITKKMIEIAHKHYISPQMVYLLDKGTPQYFNVIGAKGASVQEQISGELPADTVVISDDLQVDIQVESGLGFTMEGRKQTMQQIVEFILKLTEAGLLSQESVKVVLQKFLDTYNFGATQDFMDALEEGAQATPLNDEQITQMKVAVVEALKDAGAIGPEQDQKLVDSTKVGVVEALKDTGMLQKEKTNGQAKGPSESIAFKDLPPEGQVQMAAQAGIQLTPQQMKVHQEDQQKSQMVSQVVKSSLSQSAPTKRNKSKSN